LALFRAALPHILLAGRMPILALPDPEHDIADTDTEDTGVITVNSSGRKHIRVAPSDAATDDEEK
jgi:hypothetical protein